MGEINMLKEDRLYIEEFGHIPDDVEGRVKYILGKRFDNTKTDEMISKESRKIKRIKWIPFSFTMWKIPIPAARPRVNNSMGYPQIYVPKARQEANWFKEYIKENDVPVISSPCTIDIAVYLKTPTSFNIMKKVLAELGLIRPWSKSDWDNFAKTVCDQIQHGMLSDDSLIIEGSVKKFYSIKPRIDVSGKYMSQSPNM